VFYDLVIVFRLDMGFFLNDLVDDIKYNKIIFYPIDLLSNLYRSLRRVERDYIKRLYYYYQEILLRYWEARFLKIADLNVFVSSIDSTLAQKLYKNTKNIRGFRNGIEQYKGGYLIQDLSAPYRIGFSGDYSYKPNRDAAHFIINKIAPALAKLGISFEIYLIGRNPDYLMLSSQSSDKVRFYITNEVDCIDEWLEKLDIFICPLFSGAGMKNKILKALSIGLPIISTRHGIEGINELVNGVNYIECDNDDAHSWIVKISYLLDNKSMRSSMSLEGKQIVQQRYSWKSVVEDISNSLVFDK
jgi:glycosyltransferase involved in cell wall biosynthesis